MRTLVIAFLLALLPHFLHGATAKTQVNGANNATKSDATQQVEMNEAAKVNRTGKNDPNKIPIHCGPGGRVGAAAEMGAISANSIADCPAGGAIKDHPGDGKGKTIQFR